MRARRERVGAMWRCACALALLCAALAHVDAEKRAEMSAVPFVMGSRYGRSSPRLIAPRNDRFFMGSRYGKRSETAAGERAESTGAKKPVRQESLGRVGVAAPALLCEYTEVYPLYRCVPTHTNSHYVNRRSNNVDAGPGERV